MSMVRGMAGPGGAWPGEARYMARRGAVRQCGAWRGKVHGAAGQGKARPGAAWQGKARRGEVHGLHEDHRRCDGHGSQ